jgi:hypothetical protein
MIMISSQHCARSKVQSVIYALCPDTFAHENCLICRLESRHFPDIENSELIMKVSYEADVIHLNVVKAMSCES